MFSTKHVQVWNVIIVSIITPYLAFCIALVYFSIKQGWRPLH